MPSRPGWRARPIVRCGSRSSPNGAACRHAPSSVRSSAPAAPHLNTCGACGSSWPAGCSPIRPPERRSPTRRWRRGSRTWAASPRSIAAASESSPRGRSFAAARDEAEQRLPSNRSVPGRDRGDRRGRAGPRSHGRGRGDLNAVAGEFPTPSAIQGTTTSSGMKGVSCDFRPFAKRAHSPFRAPRRKAVPFQRPLTSGISRAENVGHDIDTVN